MKIDKDFYPIYLFNGEFEKRLEKAEASQLTFSLERNGGFRKTVSVAVLPDGRDDNLNFTYAERLIKTVLWIYGGFKLQIRAESALLGRLLAAYRKGGLRDFDVCFFEKVYGVPFVAEYSEAIDATADEKIIPSAKADGARIGFDAGGSDMKIAAVLDGKTLFSDEIVWHPKINSNPEYHISKIKGAIEEARRHLPRVDKLGVSSAGIYIDNETRVASLFIKVPDGEYGKVRTVYKDIARELKVPLTVANDGDVAALAGSMELKLNNLLGIALGTSEAVGYVDADGCLTGRLNELAFVPVDVNPDAEIDDWSGDYGAGAKYLSQDGVIKLAEKAGISLKNGETPAEKLKLVQQLAEKCDISTENVFYDVGCYLAYSLMYYLDFYGFDNVLLMGRVMSGRGGEIIFDAAKEVLKEKGFSDKIKLILPDEKSRRVGQAVAAAYL